jgi:hypothetical protein
MSVLIPPRRETVAAPVALDVSAPESTLTFVAWLRDRQTDSTDVV